MGVSLKRDKVSVTGHNNVLFGWGFFAFLFLVSFSGHTTGHVESQFLDQGWSPQSLQWKCGVSTTGLSRELRKKVCARHWDWNRESCIRPYTFAERVNLRLNALTFKGSYVQRQKAWVGPRFQGGRGGYIRDFGRDEGFTSVYLSPNTSSCETATAVTTLGSFRIIYQGAPRQSSS